VYEYLEELDEMNWSARGIPWIPEPSRRFNLLFTVEGSGIQGTRGNVLNQYLSNTSIGTTVNI
jgi:hypothetical protein